jgi:hypothetical protein
MKDIMQRLAELEATAPKAPARKKMITEDSVSPPVNKKPSLKDMFHQLSEAVVPGQKPLPVLDPQNKQAGAGFVTSNNPAVQNMLKNLDPKDVQIVQAPGQQPAATGQQPQATAAGQPNPNQLQTGQQAMKEVDMGQAEKGNRKSTSHIKGYKVVDSSGKVISKHRGQRDAIQAALKNDEYSVKVIKDKKLDELSPELVTRARDKRYGQLSSQAAASTGTLDQYAKPSGATVNKYWDTEKRNTQSRMAGQGASMPNTSGSGEHHMMGYNQGKSSPATKTAHLQGSEMDQGAQKLAKIDRNKQRDLARGKMMGVAGKKLAGTANVPAKSVAEGAKVDRMVKHIEKSEEKLGKSKDEAQDIAWATANKRGMLDNKNKKAVKEGFYSVRSNQLKQELENNGWERIPAREVPDHAKYGYRKNGVGRFYKVIDEPYHSFDVSFVKPRRVIDKLVPLDTLLELIRGSSVTEGDIAPTDGIDTKGAGLGAGRSMTTLEGKEPQVEVIDNAFNRENYKDLIGKKYPKSKAPSYARVKEVTESKKGVNPFAKKDDKASAKAPAKGKKPDFLDLDKDGNKKEPMKKAAADKKKKKVDESMNHRISAARFEGKAHGLKGHAHCGKSYEDLGEMKAYHEGYKEGLDECYGQGVYETAPATPPATVGGMADQEMEEGKLGKALTGAALAATLGAGGMMAKGAYDYHQKEVPGLGMSQGDFDRSIGHDPAAGRPSYFGRNTNEDEMEEGNAFTAALAKTPKGGKFSVGGKTFTDRTGYDAKVNEYAFESLDQQLNALLNESEEVNEGLSVSISKGQQNSPDSVTITAQDAEAEHLLAFVKNAGLGLFGDDNADTHSSAMSVQPSHGAPDEVGAGGIDIGVVDGHDGMMGLMQKLSGIQAGGAEDYADEEGDEEQLYGNHEEASKKDCGCDGDCECSDYDQPSNEATCNECGGMMEAGHSCSSEMVDEVESEDQMEFEVAEANAPDTGEAESTADEDAEAEEDAALATSNQQNKTNTVNEGGDGGEASEEGPESKEGETDEEGETVSESFANLFRKLAFIAEESQAEEDDKAEKAAKKVAKDIEHDEGHKGKDDDKAEKAGEKVKKDIEYDDKKDKKEKVDEWANNAGPGKTVSDTTFEQDIDFMTKVIAGGLNKPKSTGQTTIPIIAGQDDRTHDNPMDWATLAGIKK